MRIFQEITSKICPILNNPIRALFRAEIAPFRFNSNMSCILKILISLLESMQDNVQKGQFQIISKFCLMLKMIVCFFLYFIKDVCLLSHFPFRMIAVSYSIKVVFFFATSYFSKDVCLLFHIPLRMSGCYLIFH